MPALEIPFNFIIILLYGVDDNDKDVYHYVAIREEKIKEFFATALSGNTYDLADYGVVVHSGYDNPDEAIKDKMTRLYGCNHDSIVTL